MSTQHKKRKAESCGERVIRHKGIGTKHNPLILHARQLCTFRTNSQDILFSLMCTEQGGYYKFNGLKRNSPLEWEIKFVNKGIAVLSVMIQNQTKLRDIFVTIKGYHKGHINGVVFRVDDSTLCEDDIDPYKIYTGIELGDPLLETTIDFVGKPLSTDKTRLPLAQFVFIPEFFQNDSDILAHVKKHYSSFHQAFNDQTLQNWFWFALLGGCKKLFFFLNFSNHKILHETNQFGELPLHIALKSSNPHKLSKLIIQMMGETTELGLCDAAGMSPTYLATELKLWDILEVLHQRSKRAIFQSTFARLQAVNTDHYSWARDQFIQYGNAHLTVPTYTPGLTPGLCDQNYYRAPPLQNQIFWAAEFGILPALQQLIQSGITVNSPNKEFGDQPIHYAAHHGHLQLIEVLLNFGAHVEATNDYNETPMHYAAQGGHVSVITRLSDAGARVDSVDSEGFQPIHYAAAEGHIEVVEKLFALGGRIDAVSGKYGMQPIHCAAGAGKTLMLHLLLQLGANIDALDLRGRKPIHYAVTKTLTMTISVRQKTSSKIFHELLQLGAKFDVQDNNRIQPLHIAAEWGMTQIVTELLQFGVPVDVRDNEEHQPIHFGAMSSKEVVELLVANGAKFNAKTASGKMPIHFAAERGDDEIICYLLELGAQVNDTDANGRQPIHFAAESGGHSTLLKLIELGANIDAKDFEGKQPVHLAAASCDAALVVLLQKGAKVDAVDYKGMQPIHIAAKQGSGWAVEELVENGADAEAITLGGMTPLHFAASCGARELLEYLIVDLGVDVDANDGAGKTALDYADSYMTVNWLMELGATITSNIESTGQGDQVVEFSEGVNLGDWETEED